MLGEAKRKGQSQKLFETALVKGFFIKLFEHCLNIGYGVAACDGDDDTCHVAVNVAQVEHRWSWFRKRTW